MKTIGSFFFGLAIFFALIQPISAQELNQSSNYSGFQTISSSHVSTNLTFNDTWLTVAMNTSQSSPSSQSSASISSQNTVSEKGASSNSTETTSPGKSPVTYTTDPITKREYVNDQVIVRYNTKKFQSPGVLSAHILDSNAKIGATVDEDFSNSGLPGMQVVKIPQNVTVDDAITEYRKNPDVLYAEPNYIYHISAVTPNDPYYSTQWGLHNTETPGADIAAPNAWGISTGSSSVVVAVIDSGVDYNHPDLAANMWTNTGEIPSNGIDDDGNGYVDDVRGWNFYNGNNDPMDGMTYLNTYHGTHCSGIIGAVGNNGVGVCGVNWNVKIMPLRVADQNGSLTVANAALAINYANANGADVISNSWGGTGPSQALSEAINNSHAVVVCAAGNYGTYTQELNNDIIPIYPASYTSDNIIAVAATNSSDTLASFSHYGQISVDLAAPGVNIYSTNKSSGSSAASYQYLSGTSMATPQVSGVAALVKSVNPRLTNLQIKDIILNNVDVIPSLSEKVNTSGRLNAYKAVLAALGTLAPVANFTGTPITGVAPFTVVFTDQSTNTPGTWNWTFGDGNVTNATDRNPVHTYLATGTYNVSLNVTNAHGFSNVTKSGYIVVTRFPTTKIGVYNNGVWYLDYNGNGTWEGAAIDKSYNFGGPGNVSLVGDWNGDGKTEIGVTNGVDWYLDANGNGTWDGTPSDKYGYFGITGYTPVVGDWNGDNKTEIGVTNSVDWYLDANGNGTWDGTPSDKYGYFGITGYTPVVGNWSGDVSGTRIGVTNGVDWYLDSNGNGTWDGQTVDKHGYFGISGYTPVVGDWNGDGKTEIGVTNGVDWYLDDNGNGVWDGTGTGNDKYGYFGITGYTPVVGDWNGDGKTEIGVTNSVDWYLDSNGNGAWDGQTVDKHGYFGITGWTPVTGKWS